MIGVEYLNPSSFSDISLILGIRSFLRFIHPIKFLKSLRNCAQLVFVFGWKKDGYPYSELFYLYKNPNETREYTSFFDIYACTFGTGCGLEQTDLAYSFNLKSIGSFFHVPKFPFKKSSNFCSNPIRSFRWSSDSCWHFSFVTFFLSYFSYLASNISPTTFLFKNSCT